MPRDPVTDPVILEPLSQAEQALVTGLLEVEDLVTLLDDRFRIPGTGFRFGLDGVLGLLPAGGDLGSAALSLYLVGRLTRLGLPFPVTLQMLGNVALDAIVGTIPVIGDLFDFGFKANRRTLARARRYFIDRHPAIEAYLDRGGQDR